MLPKSLTVIEQLQQIPKAIGEIGLVVLAYLFWLMFLFNSVH